MTKKILRFRSRSEAETFRDKMKELCPGTFMSIYLKGTGYHILVSGAFSDTEIQKAAGLARITDYREITSGPGNATKQRNKP